MLQKVPAIEHSERKGLAVVGTLNVDHVWKLETLPRPGETVLINACKLHWGGKGGNQAVAAARFGAQVSMLSMLGDDADGSRYIEHLKAEGIDTDNIRFHEGLPSGTAYIYVDKQGENMILVDSGATTKLNAEVVARYLPGMLQKSAAVLLPLELPLDAALETLHLADEFGVRSILNASPVPSDFPWGKYPIDTVIVNEHECLALFGETPSVLASLPMQERRYLLTQRKICNLVITQGADPTVMLSERETVFTKNRVVAPLDTVGAGDTFAGTLAAQIAKGAADWSAMISLAGMAATLSTLKLGAQSAMPTYEEVLRAQSLDRIGNKEAVTV